ncbi:uncharacterized protein LOC128957661 [Oppia nitens]|uniref:uncharacterized protein LOC128957661 n=1 Tax=Oppia nitens TaxID=1686743 RepID=UPI0023DAA98C|nr:uncharacterized protein LOC128957661 [Oppia nitens]
MTSSEALVVTEHIDWANSLDDDELMADYDNDDNNSTQTKIVYKTMTTTTTENAATNDRQISDEELYSLYQSFDINFDEVTKKYTNWRLDVIHIRGVQDMSSEDVLKYFDDFDPNSIEWVNDLSCNILFGDRKAAAIAMTTLTTSLILKTSGEVLDYDIGIEVIDAKSLSVPVPPGHRWRLGVTHSNSKALLLRFATNSDRKVRGSRGISEYYVKYGLPLSDDIKVATNAKKRRFIRHQEAEVEEGEDTEEIVEELDSEFEMKSKRLRLRMRADEEEQQSVRNRLSLKNKRFNINRDNDVHQQQQERKSIWERLGLGSVNDVVNEDIKNNDDDDAVLQISVDNRTNSRTIWKDRPMRSTISVVNKQQTKNVLYDKNDLRTKITKTKSF